MIRHRAVSDEGGRPRWSRRRLAAIVVGLGVFALLFAAPMAALAAGGTVVTPGNCLNVRTGPSNIYNSVGCLADGTPVDIVCQTEGETIDGQWGPTDLWDYLDSPASGFVGDGFVNTGTNHPVAPPC